MLCSRPGGQHPATFDLVASCPAAEPIFTVAASQASSRPCPQAEELNARSPYAAAISLRLAP